MKRALLILSIPLWIIAGCFDGIVFGAFPRWIALWRGHASPSN